MSETVERIDLDDGNVLEVYQDTDPQSPREWDNLGVMFIKHKNYDFGDKDVPIPADQFESWDEVKDYIEGTLKSVVCLPIYMYDHSGITIATTPFSCNWDSGQVGFIYTTNKKLDEIGTKLADGEEWKDFLLRIKTQLEAEVKVMDQYVTGDVYSYIVKDQEGTDVDSCSGFFGSDVKTNGMLDNIEGSPVNLDDL